MVKKWKDQNKNNFPQFPEKDLWCTCLEKNQTNVFKVTLQNNVEISL